MDLLPPPLPKGTPQDHEHLKLLAVLHFVVAGLSVAGLVFIALHFTVMNAVMNNPEMFKKDPAEGKLAMEMFGYFNWLYLMMGVLMVAGGIGNLLSGLFIRKRTNRMFSMVIAGINCLQFPLGTALGVFTIMVLLRDSVQDIYRVDD